MAKRKRNLAPREVSLSQLRNNPDAYVSMADMSPAWHKFEKKLDRMLAHGPVPDIMPMKDGVLTDPDDPLTATGSQDPMAGYVGMTARQYNKQKKLERKLGNVSLDPPRGAVRPPTPSPDKILPPGLPDFFYSREGRGYYWELPPEFKPEVDPTLPGGPHWERYQEELAAAVRGDIPPARKPPPLHDTPMSHPANTIVLPPTATSWVEVLTAWVAKYKSRRAWCKSMGVHYMSSYNWTRGDRMCLPAPHVLARLVDRVLAAVQVGPQHPDYMSTDHLDTLLRLHAMPRFRKSNPVRNPGDGSGSHAIPAAAPRVLERSINEQKAAGVLPWVGRGGGRPPMPKPSMSRSLPDITPLVVLESLRAVRTMTFQLGSVYAAALVLGVRQDTLTAFLRGVHIPGRPAFMAMTTWAYQAGEKYKRYVASLSVMARARRKRGEIKAAFERGFKQFQMDGVGGE